jgi:hypothetical protein
MPMALADVADGPPPSVHNQTLYRWRLAGGINETRWRLRRHEDFLRCEHLSP